MRYENEEAFEKIKENLRSIPNEITTTMNIKELVRQMEDELKKEMRRRISYI